MIINEQYESAANSPNEEMLTFAEAWIDRFQAVGGSFGYVYRNGERESAGMILPMPYTWAPPEAHNPALSPCDCILEASQHEGAAKMLLSFLSLVPGLKDAVYELAGERRLFIGDDRGSVSADEEMMRSG